MVFARRNKRKFLNCKYLRIWDQMADSFLGNRGYIVIFHIFDLDEYFVCRFDIHVKYLSDYMFFDISVCVLFFRIYCE